MATNADLIAHAKANSHVMPTCNCIRQLADALEAAEAQVARFKKIVRHYRDAKVMANETAWPADLLEAVQHIYTLHHDACGTDCTMDTEARATLQRYGLVPEEAR